MISTGMKYLDKLTGGIRLGDNVVWQISNAVPIEHFIKNFFNKANDFQKTIIYVNFNYSPHTICKRFSDIFNNFNFLLIDAFTRGKGNSDPVFLDFYHNEQDFDLERIRCIDEPGDIRQFIAVMNEVQNEHRDGSFYVFDSLTGMNELWKDESLVLDFFAFTCPKLYELNTIAYWILEQEAHSKEFIAGLTHITQIVLSLYNTSSDYFALKIHKLEDRPSTNLGTPHTFRIIDREIHFEEIGDRAIMKIGTKVKGLRKASGTTQAELAARLNMTPGAISQIENELITPSLTTLVHIASFFRKPVEYFIHTGLPENHEKGYRVFRKKDTLNSLSKNMRIQQLFDDKNAEINPYFLILEENETVEGPVMLHKGREIIIVVNGVLKLTIDGEGLVINKGDSILLESSFVERWSNHGKSDCEVIYIQY